MSIQHWTAALSVALGAAGIACAGAPSLEDDANGPGIGAPNGFADSKTEAWTPEATVRRPGTGYGTRRPQVGGTAVDMTVGECQNLGCSTVEAANCPAIVHDFGTRHWACSCGHGSTCITESSAQ
jgi:hypothetical protein